MADDWFPPTAANPLPVTVIDKAPANVDTYYPPTVSNPLPVWIEGGAVAMPEPPDNQLYGRRGPPGSGQWSLLSATTGPPEAPIDGAIYGRGHVGGVQAWTPVLPLTGGTLTGPLNLAADPASGLQAATRNYVDNKTYPYLPLAGGTLTGALTLALDPVNPLQASTKQYVDNAISGIGGPYLPLTGGTISGGLVIGTPPAGSLGAGTLNLSGMIRVNRNSGSLLADSFDPVLQLAGANNTIPEILLDGYGAGAAFNLRFRFARGTQAIPAPPQTSDPLGTIGFLGYATTGYVANAAARIVGVAAENWTGSANGSQLLFYTTAPGAVPSAGSPQLTLARGLVVGNPTGGDLGPGAVNAASLNVNGSAVALAAQLANYLQLSGGTLTGALNLAADPTAAAQAATKQYADTKLALAGGTMTGTLTLAADPAVGLQAATKQYVDNQVTGAPYLPLAGGTMTGPLVIGATSAAMLTINRNAAALPPATGAVGLWINLADGEQGSMNLDAHNLAPVIFMRRANNTGAAPSGLHAGDVIGNISWRGYGATGYTGNVARFQVQAAENFTDSATGSQLIIGTAAAGTTGLTNQVVIGPGLTVGTPPAPTGGMLIGDVNAMRLLVQGVVQPVEAPTDGQTYGRRSAAWAAVVPAAGGTITGTAPGQLIINRNAAALPITAGAAQPLWINGGDGESASFTFDTHGNTPVIVLRRANNTGAAPLPINAGDVIGNISWRGYGTTGYVPGNVARFQAQALETYSDTAGGTSISVQTLAPGTVSPIVTQVAIGPGATIGAGPVPPGGILVGDLSAQRLFTTNFAQNQGVQIGSAAWQASAAGADPGVGALIASSQIIVNRNAATPPAQFQPGIQVVGVDGVNTSFEAACFGAGNPTFAGRRAGGTCAVPAPIAAANTLAQIMARGFGATTWSQTRGTIQVQSAEAWTDTAQGTTFNVSTTAPGTITTAVNLTLDGLGNLTILGPTAIKAGGGSWTAPSSLAVKRNVENYTRGLAELRQLQPISFEYNGELGTIADGRRYVGLAAEAVAPLMPEMLTAAVLRQYRVRDDEDPDIVEHPTVLLDPSALTYALMNAVYELEQRLAVLEHAGLEELGRRGD